MCQVELADAHLTPDGRRVVDEIERYIRAHESEAPIRGDYRYHVEYQWGKYAHWTILDDQCNLAVVVRRLFVIQRKCRELRKQ